MALVRYLARSGQVTAGRIVFDGQDVMDLDDAALRAFRGQRAAVVYQNPGAALDPSMTRRRPGGRSVLRARRRCPPAKPASGPSRCCARSS